MIFLFLEDRRLCKSGMSVWAQPPAGPERLALGPQERGIWALLQMAQTSADVRNAIVQHEAVQRHLVSISGQVREHRMRSNRHVHAPCQPEWPTSGADGSRPFLSTEPPQMGQSDPLPAYLVGKAHGQQEPVHVGHGIEEQACALEGNVENLVDAQSPVQPRGGKSNHKSGQDEVGEPLREGDTALIAKGLNSECKREDVYAMLEESGFTNTFDLLYVPMDFVSHKSKCYFHINFKEAVDAEKFARLLQSGPISLATRSSRLVACRARIQGLSSFVREVVRGRKFRIGQEDNRPWIYIPGSPDKGCALTKELAQRLLSPESSM